VVLVWLNKIEVCSFAFREAILTVKLELSSDNRVFTPAVHLECCFGEDESTGIRNTVVLRIVECTRDTGNTTRCGVGVSCCAVVEETRCINDRCVSGSVVQLSGRTECADGVGESIDGISVVEWLSTEGSAQDFSVNEGITVADVGIRLNNPDKFFAWVVEIEFNLVGGRSDGFFTSVLKLFDEVFVWVLCHTSAFIGIKENVINVEGCSNKRLAVSIGDLLVVGSTCGDFLNGPEAFIERTKFKVNLNFVILKSDEWKGKSWVAAVPELKRNVKCCFGKCVAWCADGFGDVSSTAGSCDISKGRVGKVCKLCGVSDHLVVAIFLFTGKSELVPDVHPITILAIDALAPDFNLNHLDELFTWAVKPTGVNITTGNVLVDFRKCNL